MPALRLSVVQYLNTVPLIWGMLHGEQRGKFALQLTVPSGCADAIAQRQADVGIVPSIEYQRLDGVKILPGMSIASKREVKSVVLLSKMPLAQVQNRGPGPILPHLGGAGANPDAQVLFAARQFFAGSA